MATKPHPPWLVPGYPPLEGDVGKASVDGQLVYYPKVVRSQIDDPIANQALGSLSFMLFKEPRKFRNGKPVYGFVKLRGNWSDKTQATRHASKIIKEMDSRFQIRLAHVGHWVPITEETAFCQDMLDVKMHKDEVQLRDEATKEKTSHDKQIMREIREREEEMKSGDIYDDPTSLTYYSMRRVTAMRLVESRDNAREQLKSTEKIIRKVCKELKRLELDHSDYTGKWIERYNEERHKGGLPDFKPAEDLFDEYENIHFDNLEDSDSDSDSSKEST